MKASPACLRTEEIFDAPHALPGRGWREDDEETMTTKW
jgi:hypothetical protein